MALLLCPALKMITSQKKVITMKIATTMNPLGRENIPKAPNHPIRLRRADSLSGQLSSGVGLVLRRERKNEVRTMPEIRKGRSKIGWVEDQRLRVEMMARHPLGRERIIAPPL